MKARILTWLAAATAALANSPATAQPKWEYSPYAKDAEVVANVEQQWATALLKRDAVTLRLLRADEFTLVAPDGRLYDKAAELAVVLLPEFKLESFAFQGGKLRVYTGGVVVTGIAVVKATFRGADLSGQYRFTDVYEPLNNGWQAVLSQWTKIEESGAAKGEAKKTPAKEPNE